MKLLKKGDTIGLISPASITKEEDVILAIENLKSLGFNVKVGKNVGKKYFSFAGTDEEKIEDLHSMFEDKEVDGIVSLRGGYGCIRLLDRINYEIIKNNPKPFVGFSDLTALHMAFYTKCELQTFHGPMAVSNFGKLEVNKITLEDFFKNLTTNISGEAIGNSNIEFIAEGEVEGVLVGGNLSVLTSLIGSEFDLDYTDKILFLEDIAEPTYKIDKMLWQLKNMGVYKKIKGIILGDYNDCEKADESYMSLDEVFDSHFKNAKFPVIKNFQSGHCEPMYTLPLGRKVKISSKDKKVIII